MNLPKAIIVDIDGTIADMSNNGRDPYDMTRIMEDEPMEDVICLIESYVNSKKSNIHKVIFLTGRGNSGFEGSKKWIEKHIGNRFGKNYELITRFDDDKNNKPKDYDFKKDVYERFIKPYYNIIGIFEDRNNVVKMWRKLGLRCYQIQEGDF